MTEAPWWLPSEWQTVALAIVGAVSLTQIWKAHRRYTTGTKPRNYATAFVSACLTVASLLVLGLLEGQTWQAALRVALLWGWASPILWMIVVWAMRRWTPDLASVLGENRRTIQRRDDEEWTDEQRAAAKEDLEKSGMFSDTNWRRK